MKILVCISNVPDTTTKISFTDDKKALSTSGIQYIINPYDELALTRALELIEAAGDGTVTVINVGEAETDPTIRKALAIGANDAIRINAAPRDAYFVAKQIAKVASENNYDLIMCGRESIDYNGGKICAMLGELMDIASVSTVKKLELSDGKASMEREIEGGKEVLEVQLPLVVSATEGMAEPRIPNMRGIMSARTKPLNVVEAIEVPVLTEIVGYDQPTPRSAVKLVDADNTDELIELLHTEAKVI